ncbi:DNA N-6-adenine-methyltransferase (Dam) [Avibacterium paragallinarum]|uniref:DNA N-6-adenine-methyltransferase (Dam) n=1 Tax=Avibacterium paragallinarum TaxID=728 RepID=A0A380Z3I3_AVIPA|nr:DNA N-6-adenine-methyltransferase (Dam) [Avibacterium paragallinarum]
MVSKPHSRRANEVIDIVGGRINFIHPITGEEIKGNTKGQMVVVFDPQWKFCTAFSEFGFY